MKLAQIRPVLIQGSRLVPARRDAWVVLPFVEQLQMFLVLPVDHLEGEVYVYLRDVAAVGDGSRPRFGSTDRVTGEDGFVWELVGDMKVLGHDGILGQGFPQVAVRAVSHDPYRTRTCR